MKDELATRVYTFLMKLVRTLSMLRRILSSIRKYWENSMVTIKCKYVEKNKITTEITVSDILGTFTGITVKERFINENVSFTDVFLSINGKDYNINDLTDISFYEPAYTDHELRYRFDLKVSPDNFSFANISIEGKKFADKDELLNFFIDSRIM